MYRRVTNRVEERYARTVRELRNAAGKGKALRNVGAGLRNRPLA